MTLFHSLILGIVEGITEFLPISSTAHLILASHLLHIAQSEFAKTFEIVIQFGAILAVVYLYRKDLFHSIEVWKRILAAFIPTGILGLVFYKIVKSILLDDITLIIWTLMIGGALLIVFELLHREKKDAVSDILQMSYRQCVIIGVCQSFAMIPGVSRSAATILGGLALGIKRKTIVEFSFLLAVPTMFAASALDLIKTKAHFDAANLGALAVGFVVSFVVAVLSIQFLLGFVRKRDFKPFGVYRILAGIAMLFAR
jgi:undecaprenyl-diphosphatase